MTQDAKIYLSEQELQMAGDYQWILTKRLILDKLALLLGTAEPHLRELAAGNTWLPQEVRNSNSKLSRGENYRGLPWLMLDCPAFFSREAVFALRTFFWWGHGFALSLHLAGSSYAAYRTVVQQRFGQLRQTDWLVCVNKTEWEHHFEQDNYVPAAALDDAAGMLLLGRCSFVKITARFALNQWADVPGLMTDTAGRMLNWLKP